MPDFSPNLQTSEDALCKEELNKLGSNGMRGTLSDDLKDGGRQDLPWEAEQLAKSYGIYLEYNRAKTGAEKDWRYMVRVTIPGGGPLSSEQWRVLDALATKYVVSGDEGVSSLRLTTRQNVQFHWVYKEHLLPLVRELAECGLKTLNGCGDNTRNVMACPLSGICDVFDANALARRIAAYFELPQQPFIQIFEIDPEYLRTPKDATVSSQQRFTYGPGLLNRKFKIGISTAHRQLASGRLVPDNCVEVLTNDVGVVPVFQDDLLSGFQIYVGGGQGERNGKPSMATLAKPFAVVAVDELLPVLHAVVAVHQDFGDRQNRHWARLKYVIKKMGVDWFRAQVQERLSFALEPPLPCLDVGARDLHHGWCPQPDGLLSYGMFIENGRISDTEDNGRLKSAILNTLAAYPSVRAVITPNQDLLFIGIPVESAAAFSNSLESFGCGMRKGKAHSTLRKLSGACVGRNTCRLAYTDSEKFEPILIDTLEELGWGDVATSIGITGCERQCYRPATKAIGLVGTGLNLYQLKLLGTEDGRHQGQPVIGSDGRMYLRCIPRQEVATVIDALFRLHQRRGLPEEELGYCLRRIGMDGIIAYLKEQAATRQLMEKTFSADGVLEHSYLAEDVEAAVPPH